MGIDGDGLQPLASGEAYISTSLTSSLGIAASETFYLAWRHSTINSLFQALAQARGIDYNDTDFELSFPLTLKQYGSDFSTRFGDDEQYNQAILIDIKTLLPYMKPYLQAELSDAPDFAEFISE